MMHEFWFLFFSFHDYSFYNISTKSEENTKEADLITENNQAHSVRFKTSLFCGSDRVCTPTPESEPLNHFNNHSDIPLRQISKHV